MTSQTGSKPARFLPKVCKGKNLHEFNGRLDKYLKEGSTGDNKMAKSYQAEDINWADNSREYTTDTCVLHQVTTAASSMLSELDPKDECLYEHYILFRGFIFHSSYSTELSLVQKQRHVTQ